jgi:hypothetical protein
MPPRRSVRIGLICLLAALPVASAPARLWEGSEYTAAQRDRAVLRGLRFIESVAENPKYLEGYGDDLLWCLYSVSRTSADARVRQEAAGAARRAARRWGQSHSVLPAHPDADDLLSLATGHAVLERLGVPAAGMKDRIRAAAAGLPVRAYLLFDPAREAPPADLPARARYDLWCDALITSFFGDLYGVTLGAPYAEVIRWLPAMRPYPAPSDTAEYYAALYSITHVIYTLNHYSVYAVRPECLAPEFEFLKAALETPLQTPQQTAAAPRDPESTGEFLDTLRAFGMTARDAPIRTGVEYLLSTQNADGSWGDVKSADIYTRYHSTWTAVDGLREYRFEPARACPAFGK